MAVRQFTHYHYPASPQFGVITLLNGRHYAHNLIAHTIIVISPNRRLYPVT